MTLTQEIQSLKSRALAMNPTPQNQLLFELASAVERLLLERLMIERRECPICGAPIRVRSSLPRIAYCYCTNDDCDYSEKRSRGDGQ